MVKFLVHVFFFLCLCVRVCAQFGPAKQPWEANAENTFPHLIPPAALCFNLEVFKKKKEEQRRSATDRKSVV